MSDEMDRVQDLVLIEQEAMQARRLAQVPVPNLASRRMVCASCGDSLDPRRVRAVPYCTRCVECEARSERLGSR